MRADVTVAHARGVVADAVPAVGAAVWTQDGRDQVRQEIQQTVREAMQAAREGQREAQVAQDIQRELQRARDAVSAAQGEAGGTTSITRDATGNVVLKTPDGRTIVLGEGIVPPAALEGLVASLGAPPPPPPAPFEDQGPPEGVIKLVAIVFAFMAIMVVGWPLARAFGRRVDRRAAVAPPSPDVGARLDRIEQAVDAVAVEMERVSEAQRYAARLLTERLPESWPQVAGAAAPAAGGRDVANASRSA